MVPVNGLLYTLDDSDKKKRRQFKIILSKKLVNGVIRFLHSSPFFRGAKMGAVKTLNKLRQYGVFVYMYCQVEEAVKNYELCLRRVKVSVSYPTL